MMQNCSSQAIHILQSGDYDHHMLEDVGAFENPLPLYRISVCQKIILSDMEWRDYYIPVVERNRKECNELLQYWKDVFHYPIEEKVDFGLYEDACAHFGDLDMEELLGGSVEELVKMGYDKDEILLCYATLTYNSKILNEQIAKKTNPNVYISAEMQPEKANIRDFTSYNAYDTAYTIVGDLFDCYGFGRFWEEDNVPLDVDIRTLCELLEGAAYTQLIQKLKPLIPSKICSNIGK